MANTLLLGAYCMQRRRDGVGTCHRPGKRRLLRETRQLAAPGPWDKLPPLSFLVRKLGMNDRLHPTGLEACGQSAQPARGKQLPLGLAVTSLRATTIIRT